MPTTQAALVSLYCAVIILSINGVFAKAIPLDAVTITHARCVVALAALALFAAVQQQALKLATRRHYGAVALLGLLMAAHWVAFFKSMQVSTVAIGMLAHYSHPVLTVIAEPLLNRQLPAKADVTAGAVVFAGIVLMVPDWAAGGEALFGVGLGLISAIAFSARNIFQTRWVRGEAGTGVMFYQMLVVALVTLPLMALPGGYRELAHASSSTWQMLLALGIISTALSHTLLAISLRTLSAKTVALISCMQPPLAILLSWLMLGETPAAVTLIGGAMILAAAMYESLKTGGR